MPVWSSKGLRTAMKESCSAPDQTASTSRLPPILPPLVVVGVLLPQAVRTTAAPRARVHTTLRFAMRIYYPLAAPAGAGESAVCNRHCSLSPSVSQSALALLVLTSGCLRRAAAHQGGGER